MSYIHQLENEVATLKLKLQINEDAFDEMKLHFESKSRTDDDLIVELLNQTCAANRECDALAEKLDCVLEHNQMVQDFNSELEKQLENRTETLANVLDLMCSFVDDVDIELDNDRTINSL